MFPPRAQKEKNNHQTKASQICNFLSLLRPLTASIPKWFLSFEFPTDLHNQQPFTYPQKKNPESFEIQKRSLLASNTRVPYWFFRKPFLTTYLLKEIPFTHDNNNQQHAVESNTRSRRTKEEKKRLEKKRNHYTVGSPLHLAHTNTKTATATSIFIYRDCSAAASIELYKKKKNCKMRSMDRFNFMEDDII